MTPSNHRRAEDFLQHSEYELVFDGILHELGEDADLTNRLAETQITDVLTLGKTLGYTAKSDKVFMEFIRKYDPGRLGAIERE